MILAASMHTVIIKRMFYNLQGDVYHFTTFPNVPFLDVMTSQNDHVSFSVWGCSPASITLLEDLTPTPEGMGMFEVIIGKDNDSHVAIYQAKVGLSSRMIWSMSSPSF